MTDQIIRFLTFTRKKAVDVLVCAFCFFLIILVSACDNGHEADSSSESGSISFGIALQDEPSMQRSILAADELDEDCEAAGVETVRVEVYDEAGFYLTEDSWPCSARKGTLQNVREGSDRKIVVLCEDSNQNVRYRGEYSGITVTEGQTTDIGSVEACFFIPTELAPADGASFPPDDVTVQWEAVEGAQSYRILISENSDLSEPAIDKTTIETTFHPQDLSDSTIYYWQVYSLDSNGNEGAGSEAHWFETSYGANRPPVLDTIGNRSVEEGELLQFTISASDPNGDELTYSAGSLPIGAEFDSATQTFTWSPEYGQAENYNVLFTVTDDGDPSLTDFEEVTITVGHGNRPPVLDPIGSRSVEEGGVLQFTISASDPDGDELTYSAGNLPIGAEFDSETRTFTWRPEYGQAENYNVLFTVTDDGEPSLNDSEEVTITVGNVNRPPVLDPIGSRSVEEGGVLEFTISASDPDGDELTYSAGNLPIGAEFNNATHTFTWSPEYGQAENYNVLFTVTDNGDPSLNDSEEVTITVGHVNRPPVLNPIGSRGVEEGGVLEFTISASDPDGDELTYSAGNLPIGAAFDSETRTFTWRPEYGQAENYDVLFTVTDNGDPSLTDSEEVTITVGHVNRPPVLDPIGSRSVEEGGLLEFTISASDPDGDELTYSAGNLPIGAEFDSATRTFTWSPAYGQAENYDVMFTVTDDGLPNLSDSETVTFTVLPANSILFLNFYNNIEDEEWNGYSDLANYLRNIGFIVEQAHLNPITAGDLSGYSTIFFGGDMSRVISDNEATTIGNFVENGGGLLLAGSLGVSTYAATLNSSLNQVGNPWGINFEENMVCDPTDYVEYPGDPDGGVEFALIYPSGGHPAVEGVGTFLLNWGCSLTLSTPAVSIATTDNDAWLDENAVWDEEVHVWFCQYDDGEYQGVSPVMGAVELQSGRIIAMGDVDMWYNYWLDRFDHSQLADSIFSYLR